MRTSADYMRRARECLELAGRRQGGERTTLMEIAAAWLQLAKDAEELEKPGIGDDREASMSRN